MLTHVGFCTDFKFTYKPVRKTDLKKQNKIFCSRDKTLSIRTGVSDG
jgi:hypothetical protein